jgi:EpsI family protein
VIAAVAAVFVNIVRVFIVVYLGYATDMQHPFIADHNALGWYLFAGMVVVLLILDALLHRQPAAPAGIVSGQARQPASCENSRVRYLVVVVVAALLVSAGPAVAYWIEHLSTVENADIEFELPMGAGGWAGPVASIDDWMPQYRGAIARKQAYQKDGERVDLYIGYYPVTRQGEELIASYNRISNEDVWNISNPRGNLRQASELVVLEKLLKKRDGTQRLVWYWYRVAGRHATNKYRAKASQVLGLLTGKPDAFVIAVATTPGEDLGHARQALGKFVSAMKKPLVTLMDNLEKE